MFAHSFGVLPSILVIALLALDVIALVQVWRGRTRAPGAKMLWTAAIVLLPAIGGVGWLVNRGFERAAERLSRA